MVAFALVGIVGIALALGIYFFAVTGLAHLVPLVQHAIGSTALHWIFGLVLALLIIHALIVNWDS